MYLNKTIIKNLMAFLTLKDVEVLKLVKDNEGKTKSDIARASKYVYSGLSHTLNKLQAEKLIKVKKTTQTSVTLTEKGDEVLSRI